MGKVGAKKQTKNGPARLARHGCIGRGASQKPAAIIRRRPWRPALRRLCQISARRRLLLK
jgi:hypothetical protein